MATLIHQQRSSVGWALIGALSLSLPACQERTQATLDITTDLPCSDVTETAISVGEFSSIERTVPITITPGCQAPEELEIGTLAVVPSDDKGAAFGLRLVTAVNAEVSTCQPPEYGPQCIVSRRSTSFIDGRGFALPLVMRETCLGVLCPADQTCADGVCRDVDVDPNDCVAGDCGENGLNVPETTPWRRAIGSYGDDIPNDLAGIPGGDVVVVGSFNHSVDFGGEPHLGQGVQDAFIARLGPSGEYRWSRSLGGEGYDTALGVHVSRVSVIVVTGTFADSIDFGDGSKLTEDEGGAGFVVAYGGLGTPRWSLALTGASREAALDSATDSAGNVYVAASFVDSITVDGVDYAGAGVDGALLKIDKNGELVWLERIGGAGADAIVDVVVDSEDNIYVAGSFEGEITLGETTLQSNGGKDVLLASFDGDGEVRWATSFGDSANDLANGLAIDAADQIAVTGSLSGAATFDGVLIEEANDGGFVLRITPAGEHAWHQSFGSQVGASGGERVVFDADGRLIVSGFFYDELQLSGMGAPMVGTGVRNTFVATFDDGVLSSTRSFGASHYATSRGIAANADGSLYITGFFAQKMDFDGEPLSSDHPNPEPPDGEDPAPAPPLHSDIFLGRLPSP